MSETNLYCIDYYYVDTEVMNISFRGKHFRDIVVR